jgi:hypothetical protein
MFIAALFLIARSRKQTNKQTNKKPTKFRVAKTVLNNKKKIIEIPPFLISSGMKFICMQLE